MGYLLNISDEKLQELKIIAAREGSTIRKILEDQVDDYLKQHSKSNNPQTMIENFDREEVMAIPQIYERRNEPWDKFFSMVDKKEYKELEKAHSNLTKRMNEKYHQLYKL
jgi:hypothetical protein